MIVTLLGSALGFGCGDSKRCSTVTLDVLKAADTAALGCTEDADCVIVAPMVCQPACPIVIVAEHRDAFVNAIAEINKTECADGCNAIVEPECADPILKCTNGACVEPPGEQLTNQ